MNKRTPVECVPQSRPQLTCQFDPDEGLDDSFADYAGYRLKEAIEPLMPSGCSILVEGKTINTGMLDNAVALTARIGGLDCGPKDLVQHGINEWVALRSLVQRLEAFFLDRNDCSESNEHSFAE